MTNDTSKPNISSNKEHSLEDLRPSVRFQAVKILNRYERSSAYIDKLLANTFRQYEYSKQDRSLLTEIVYGCVRWRAKLDWVLTGFFHGDFNKCINPVKNTMRVGLYQILFLDRIPDHAAINESVEITKRLQSQKTAGLVNGVLRNIARNVKNIRYPNPQQDNAFYKSVINSYQKWLVENWTEQFGESAADKLMQALNERPGIAIRINRHKFSDTTLKDDLKNRMENLGIELEEINGIGGSYYLKGLGDDISRNDFYIEGAITIQDPSSVLVCELAKPNASDFVVDMCAAPGGKTSLMAEMMGNKGKIIAFDKFEAKLEMIHQNASRLGLDIIKTVQADATSLKVKGTPNLILADVPCSGTGTIQKHPEIKWSIEKDTIKKLVSLQRSILSNSAANLKPGGILVYSTCSIQKRENRENIEWFLQQNKDFELDRAENYIDKKFTRDGYLEVFPHQHGIMGAFAARLIKK